MKPLPSHLEYAFLGDDSTYPIIFSSELNGNDLDRLVNLVKKHRKAIEYTIDYIKVSVRLLLVTVLMWILISLLP